MLIDHDYLLEFRNIKIVQEYIEISTSGLFVLA
jgi:hypothetical protein